MRHQDLTINHILESWVFANAAARTAPGSYVPGDVGRVGFQTDTGQYFRLTSTLPGWELIAPSSPTGTGFAHLQTAQVTTPGTNSTTGVMAAVGGIITPTSTGKVLVTINGTCYDNAAGVAVEMVLRYGTGPRPNHGDPLAGTTFGPIMGAQSSAGNVFHAYSITGLITGLVVGTPYWVDVSYGNSAAGTAVLDWTTCSAVELP